MEQEREVLKDIIFTKSRYFKYFNEEVIEEFLQSMRKKIYFPENTIMSPSQARNNLYIISEGTIRIIVNSNYARVVNSGYIYGEQEMLLERYGSAKIKAETRCTVWKLNRQEFKACMRRVSVDQRKYSEFFKSVPFLRKFSEEDLKKLEDAIKVEFFTCEDQIQVKPERIYIISNGYLRITNEKPRDGNEKILKVLGFGHNFGEDTVGYLSAFYPGLECISFNKNILQEFEENGQSDEAESVHKEFAQGQVGLNIDLNSLTTIASIGPGAFGTVELVKHQKDPSKTYALKKLRKIDIVNNRLQNHVLTERNILLELNNPFVIRCYNTFRCERFVYFLMEVCLGGDLWKPLEQEVFFDEDVAQFIIGCVVEALDYLHNKQIIYRDLKPENLVLDHLGFVKVTDFGLSRKLGATGRTFSSCGTRGYIPPEILLKMGYDRGVDFWSLGIVMYEFLSGRVPFDSDNPLKICDRTLAGIDKIIFPPSISNEAAKNLIRRLCSREPADRIGYTRMDDIRKHKWFADFDWKALQSLSITPPEILVPKLKDCCDTSHFDIKSRTENRLPPEEDTRWDIDF